MQPLTVVIRRDYASDLARELEKVHELRTYHDETDAEMARLLSRSDVLVSGTFKAEWRSPTGTGLRLMHSAGAGIDRIARAALPPGCLLCNVYGHEHGLAEHTFMLMLALQRDLRGLDAALRTGNWLPERPFLSELRGKRLLILGLGHIGRELVRWGRFMDMDVTVLTRSPDPARAAGLGLSALGSLAELGARLPEADFVVVAIPAAPETVDLIGARELGRMKATAYLINIGRAAVLNEAALYEALCTRRIAGAGLDVWYQYPAAGQKRLPAHLPFHELDNVIMTPHKSTAETMTYRWGEIARNIGRFARGEPLVNQILP